jgi:uncharacterized BrkB/YihY/UPF0761 family membrane protein
VFSVISSAVGKAFFSRALLWATFGGVLALWQVSGAVRAVMGAFDRIYGASFQRPFIRRYLISFALAMATGACFILAALCLELAPCDGDSQEVRRYDDRPRGPLSGWQ